MRKALLILAVWTAAGFILSAVLHYIGFWYKDSDDEGHQGGPTS